MLTMAAKEGGWSASDLAHNMPLSNPFGVNRIHNGRAVGNVNYKPIGGLPTAIAYWEHTYGTRVYGTDDPQTFVSGLQHPKTGRPYNTAHADIYEGVFAKVYDSMGAYMEACGVSGK